MQARRTSGDMNEAIGTFAAASPAGTTILPCPQGVSMNYKDVFMEKKKTQ